MKEENWKENKQQVGKGVASWLTIPIFQTSPQSTHYIQTHRQTWDAMQGRKQPEIHDGQLASSLFP